MRAFVLFLALAACSPGPVREVNPHTGITSRASAVNTIDRRYPARLDVRVVRLSRGAEERFALLTYVTRSDLNYPRIESVWSFERALPYERFDRRRVGRDRQEAGMVPLTRDEVVTAAETGLTFEMIGLRGHYGGTAEPGLFREILGP